MNILFLSEKKWKNIINLKYALKIFFKTLEIFKEYIGKFSNAILQLRNYT